LLHWNAIATYGAIELVGHLWWFIGIGWHNAASNEAQRHQER